MQVVCVGQHRGHRRHEVFDALHPLERVCAVVAPLAQYDLHLVTSNLDHRRLVVVGLKMFKYAVAQKLPRAIHAGTNKYSGRPRRLVINLGVDCSL